MKIRIEEIKAGTKTGMSLFHGEGDSVTGTWINFQFVSGAGMFYAGQNEAVAIEGRTASFFFPGCDAGKALAILQASAETVNYAHIHVSTAWRLDVSEGIRIKKGYDSATRALEEAAIETFGTEAEALEALEELAREIGIPSTRMGVLADNAYSDPVCIRADRIINLTQHTATAEQVEAGVVDPAEKSAVQAALTFDAIPTASEMAERAELLARIAADSGCKRAMIGGAPFFMAPLERALLAAGIQPVYAFSVRDSREESDGNGGIRKINVFRHVGFVEAAQ